MPVDLQTLSLGTDRDQRNAEDPRNNDSSVLPATETPPSNEALPTYSTTDPVERPVEISPEEMSSAFSNLKLPDIPTEFPTADHCLAHLKLLYSFQALKEDIGYTDGLFGLWDERCETLEGQERDAALAKMREKRWALYIARAVERFEVWWLKYLCALEECKRLEGKEMVNTSLHYTHFVERGIPRKWVTTMLPPIDILMVWHAFMLNPRNYLEDCIRFGLKDLWASGIPWPAIDEAIDTSFKYNVPGEGIKTFSGMTGLSWHNVDDPMTKALYCPRCTQQLDIPWTTCGSEKKSSPEEIIQMSGTGYGDRDLSYICHKCGGMINHDLLRVVKFRRDTEKLITQDWPLGGTIILPATGAPVQPAVALWHKAPNLFPNRLIGMELRARVLELINPRSTNQPTMNDVRDLIEGAIQDRSIIMKVNRMRPLESGRLPSAERIAIRKMMSRYWENTSIFALELGGAVIRQSIFVDKMHGIDWLHSPAARSTMDRLLMKYARFMQIIATNPLNVAVPTLDVDLGWHTHQLSPQPYYAYTVKMCRKFIDHDDKIDENALSTNFEWTSKTYQKLYREVYSECTCWYCESIRSKHISSTRIFGLSKHEKVLNSFYDSGAAKLCPPDNSAHISAHNAVKPMESTAAGLTVAERLRQKHKNDLEAAYQKACARAAAKGRPIPQRRGAEDYYMGPWGYPYLMYGPYMSVGMMGGMYYAGDPCMMPVGAGMAGNCCAGTCAGGIGAGGCGSPGGCGGMAGGCGGAGGGGCGGGGVGGCGGGGGGGCGGGGGGGCGGGGGS